MKRIRTRTLVPDPALWDSFWQTAKLPPDPTSQRLVGMLAGLVPAGRLICEVGCGTGRDSLQMAKLGGQVVSVDFSMRALEMVHRNSTGAPASKPALVAGDTLRLPFADRTFDALFHQGLLEHFRDPMPVLQEQIRVLKPGGYLLVDVPQRLNWYAVRKRLRMARGTWFAGWETDFTPGGLRRTLHRAGLEPVSSYAYGYDPPLFWLLRHLHEVGTTRFGRPLFPRPLASAYERAWKSWEGSSLACYALACIGVLARKPS